MARYIERAENVARVLDVTYQMSLVPSARRQSTALWQSALEICGDEAQYHKVYGEITSANVIQYLVMDMNHPSSIYSALRSARENARMVKVAMSVETWENINDLWLALGRFNHESVSMAGLGAFCEWVKSRSHLFRGVCYGTMLRDEAFSFVRLGTFIERADNTARLLSHQCGLSSSVGTDDKAIVDYYEWSAVLRSVSALQAYQKIYTDTIDPVKVSELLMLRGDMPRSLHACYDEIMPIVEQLSGDYQMETKRLAKAMHTSLHESKMSTILANGISAFLKHFIQANQMLSNEIQRGLFGTKPLASE
jgi:uncharacterized alpha-E superfamily protein